MSALWLALTALLAFVISGLTAVAAGRNVPYRVADESALHSMSTTSWYENPEDAAQVVVYYNSETIRTLRKGNNGKARLIVIASVLQVLAVTCLAAALGLQFVRSLAV